MNFQKVKHLKNIWRIRIYKHCTNKQIFFFFKQSNEITSL